jgi:hypothetical protein
MANLRDMGRIMNLAFGAPEKIEEFKSGIELQAIAEASGFETDPEMLK